MRINMRIKRVWRLHATGGVVAAGGILGTVTNVKDKVVVLKVADNVKIEVQRASITSVETGPEEKPSA